MIIGIDATNIRSGGGVTHLKQLLDHTNTTTKNFDKIIIWGDGNTLKQIADVAWLEKKVVASLSSSNLHRFLWKIFYLTPSIKKEKCDILFVPGSLYLGRFRPFVTISQNILPFDSFEKRKFFPGFNYFRLNLLKYLQSKTFVNANGVIFLTNFAAKYIKNKLKRNIKKDKIVPHGISTEFRNQPKEQKDIREYTKENPYKILYVSILNTYKHQDNVALAVVKLREEGYNVSLDLVGPPSKEPLKRLQEIIQENCSDDAYIKYHGAIPFSDIWKFYINSDAFVFASSCENMPNIMIEAMASGLVIASSNVQPMPEILGDAGFYFDPFNVDSIYQSLLSLIHNKELRAAYAQKSHLLSKEFSWEKCSYDTFAFIKNIYEHYDNG